MHSGFSNRRFKIVLLQCHLVVISEINLNTLKCVQNTLARGVTGTRRRDHILPVLADLHWLPIRARVTYKIATLVFKIREVKQSMYLADLIEDYKPVRELRSTFRLLLKVPCIKQLPDCDHFALQLPRYGTVFQITLDQLIAWRHLRST